MSQVSRKTQLRTIDGTPKKRLFLSIISDYDLKTGICELVDNALDLWVGTERSSKLLVEVGLNVDRQLIQVKDNAGGVRDTDAELLVSPGASRNEFGQALIGIFGVGGKRAGVALGELVEIKSRHSNERSFQVDLSSDWIESPDWSLDLYEIPAVEPGTTTVDISKVRQSFDSDDVAKMQKHLGETYAKFLQEDCAITLNRAPVDPRRFDLWAYPPQYPPRTSSFQIEPAEGRSLDVTISAGLIRDRDPEGENYGVYFYCNDRLIMKEVKAREVGYYVSAEAGVPHPDASLCRVIVEFRGAAELMPWNSSKSGINFNHPAFMAVRRRVIEFTSYYTKVSRALKNSWVEDVFKHQTGTPEEIPAGQILAARKMTFPKPPSSRTPSHIEVLRSANVSVFKNKPWTLGLIEAMGLVDLISRQDYITKNRAALILLDSNFEIAIKEYIVSNKAIFPAHKYTDTYIANLFKQRSSVVNEIQQHAKFPQRIINKINYYYVLRNSLIHQRATVLITDDQVQDYRETIERVLKKLFGVKFPD